MSEAWFTTRHDVLTQQPYLWLQIFRGRRGPEVLIVDYTSRRIIQLCTFRRAWPGQEQEPDDRLFRRSWGWHLLRASLRMCSEEPCWRWVTMQLHCKFLTLRLSQGVDEECRKGSSCACRVPAFDACCPALLRMPGLGNAHGPGCQRWLDLWSP